MAHDRTSARTPVSAKAVVTLLILTLVSAACMPRGAAATPAQADDLASARSALIAFFDALNAGRYADAAALYGGDYEQLIVMNPDAASDDHAGLWQRGCNGNGFQCLQVLEIVEAAQLSPNEYRFKVRFKARDGGAFVLGPCCGATEAEQPSLYVFDYVVARLPEAGNTFRVQGLPVYMP